jgi:hypothetical protein
MGLNLPRARRGLLRALAGRYVSMEDVQARTWVVCPEARSVCAPALYPAGAVEKIKQLSPYRNWPTEELLIKGGETVLPPTTGHLLRDVDVIDGRLYCGAYEWKAGFGDAPWWLPADLPAQPPLARATLETTQTGSEFFGCLLLDDFPLALLAENPAELVALNAKPSGHEAGYRDGLGLPPRRVLRRARIGELTVFIDPAYNASKADRYRQLRANFRQRMAGQSGEPAGTGRLYISRGMSGQRRVMSNEAALEAALRLRGFTVIDPMKLSVAEIARLSLGAKLVVSIEGSQISHAQYAMADDAALVVLQPPNRFCLQYKEYTDALGMRFGFVVCDQAEEGFQVDIDELLRLLDRLET